MYVVEHINSGLYFKKGSVRSRWGSTLVRMEDATVFRSKSGIVNSLGELVPLFPPKYTKKGRKKFSTRKLNAGVWKIVPISIERRNK